MKLYRIQNKNTKLGAFTSDFFYEYQNYLKSINDEEAVDAMYEMADELMTLEWDEALKKDAPPEKALFYFREEAVLAFAEMLYKMVNSLHFKLWEMEWLVVEATEMEVFMIDRYQVCAEIKGCVSCN